MSDKTLSSYRCTNCGAPIEIQPWDEIVKCEYCETVFKVEKTNNEEIVINNIQNITVEKKGFAQSAFEYFDKRAAARERAEAEERARKAEAEARKRQIWLKIGEFLLWSCFFPIMLIVTIVKHSNEKKENEQRIANGIPPKNLTPMPTVLMIIGGVMFVCSFFSALTENRASYSNMNSITYSPSIIEQPDISPAVADNTDIDNAESSETKWYNKEIFLIKQNSFPDDVETVDKTVGSFKCTVPVKWRVREGENDLTCYPIEGTNNAFLYVTVTELTGLDYSNFEGYSEEVVNNALLDNYYNGVLKNKEHVNCSAKPCALNNFKGIMIEGKYINSDINASGNYINTVFIAKKTMISVVDMMGNGENNLSIDDYVAVLNSIQTIE